MKYVVELNGVRRDVEVDGENVSIDGATLAAHLEDVPGTPVRLVTIGNEVHRVVARRGQARGSYVLWVDGWRFEGEALDERTRAIREITAVSSAAAGPAPVTAPMPGLIVRVNVSVGDVVEPGQGVVVMEAMKMENQLRVVAGATVRSVNVSEGQAVEKGMVLVEFEGG
jgi:acetyl/propionyl-CoA carboxylase alpha subunit